MPEHCDFFKRRGIETLSEEEWRKKHEHGSIVEEDYQGVQPPTYTLEILRCLKCDAKLVRRRQVEMEES
jgi:hypothetical protein